MKTKHTHVDCVCDYCGKPLSEDWCAAYGKVCQACDDKLTEEAYRLMDEENQ